QRPGGAKALADLQPPLERGYRLAVAAAGHVCHATQGEPVTPVERVPSVWRQVEERLRKRGGVAVVALMVGEPAGAPERFGPGSRVPARGQAQRVGQPSAAF